MNFPIPAPKIEKDDFLVPETPFERYVYFLAFRHPRGETKDYMKFFNSYVESTPSWDGPEDNSDVLHPALLKQGEFDYPQVCSKKNVGQRKETFTSGLFQ